AINRSQLLRPRLTHVLFVAGRFNRFRLRRFSEILSCTLCRSLIDSIVDFLEGWILWLRGSRRVLDGRCRWLGLRRLSITLWSVTRPVAGRILIQDRVVRHIPVEILQHVVFEGVFTLETRLVGSVAPRTDVIFARFNVAEVSNFPCPGEGVIRGAA